MSEMDEVDEANRAETVRFFAFACLIVAALGLAQTTARLVAWKEFLEHEARYLSSFASLMSSWCLSWVLLGAGLGLLWTRPWGRWLALGYGVINVTWAVIGGGYGLVSRIPPVDLLSIGLGVADGISAVLARQFSIPLLVFMLLLGMRTTLRSAPHTPDAVSPGIPGGLAAREVRTMGWLVLVFATWLLLILIFGVALTFVANSAPAVEPRDPRAFAAFTQNIHAGKIAMITLTPFFLATFLASIAAGFGMVKGRPWARRTAVLSSSAWIAVITAQILVSWFVMLRYPIPDIPAPSPVAELAGTVAHLLGNLECLIFPALFLVFVCLPHIRRFCLSLAPSLRPLLSESSG